MGLFGSKSSLLAFHLGLIVGFISTFYLVGNLIGEGAPRPGTQPPHGLRDPEWIVERSALFSVAHPHLAGKDWGEETNPKMAFSWVSLVCGGEHACLAIDFCGPLDFVEELLGTIDGSAIKLQVEGL